MRKVRSGRHSSGLCQDGNTSSRVITEVKHLGLNQFSVDQTFWGVVSAAVGRLEPSGLHKEVHVVHH